MSYLEQIAGEAGFTDIVSSSIILRQEYGEPVHSLLASFERAPDPAQRNARPEPGVRVIDALIVPTTN